MYYEAIITLQGANGTENNLIGLIISVASALATLTLTGLLIKLQDVNAKRKAELAERKAEQESIKVKDATKKLVVETTEPMIAVSDQQTQELIALRKELAEQKNSKAILESYIDNLRGDLNRAEEMRQRQNLDHEAREKALEAKLKEFEVALNESNIRQGKLEDALKESNANQQLLLEQIAKVGDGFTKVGLEMEQLRLAMDGQANLLNGVDAALKDIKGSLIPVTLKKDKEDAL